VLLRLAKEKKILLWSAGLHGFLEKKLGVVGFKFIGSGALGIKKIHSHTTSIIVYKG
jgi:hypothetical protein